jgi:hypothetical protein
MPSEKHENSKGICKQIFEINPLVEVKC